MAQPDDRAQSIAIIRREMAWWGHPLDHMTDEEIEQGVTRAAEGLAHFGISSEDAGLAFVGLSRALREREETLR